MRESILVFPLLAIGILGLSNSIWSIGKIRKADWQVPSMGEWPLVVGIWVISLLLIVLQSAHLISNVVFYSISLFWSLLFELFAFWLLYMRCGEEKGGVTAPLIMTGVFLTSNSIVYLAWLSHLFPLLNTSMAQWKPGNTDDPSPLSIPMTILWIMQLVLYLLLKINWTRRKRTSEQR